MTAYKLPLRAVLRPRGQREHVIYDDSNAYVGSVCNSTVWGDDCDRMADLFASAPDLLAACKALLPQLERSGFGERADGLHDHADNAVAMLRRAIAKAEGGAS